MGLKIVTDFVHSVRGIGTVVARLTARRSKIVCNDGFRLHKTVLWPVSCLAENRSLSAFVFGGV